IWMGSLYLAWRGFRLAVFAAGLIAFTEFGVIASGHFVSAPWEIDIYAKHEGLEVAGVLIALLPACALTVMAAIVSWSHPTGRRRQLEMLPLILVSLLGADGPGGGAYVPAPRGVDKASVRQPAAVGSITVEAASALSPEMTRVNQLPQQRRSRETRVVEPVIEHTADVEVGIEADEVRQLEGSHRMVQAQLGPPVDVLARSQSLHQCPDRLVDEGHQHPVDDEARIVEGGDRSLAQGFG